MALPPPPHGAPERRLLVTCMRNEGAFLLEWLAWNRLLGFTDFLIYSNDCEDGSDAMLARLAALGLVIHRPNPRRGSKSVQWQALAAAMVEPVLQDCGWIMVADVDEFLLVHVGAGRLDDLLANAPDTDAFALDWRTFGSAGEAHFRPGLVTARFTRAAPERLLWPWRAVQFKTLFRNRGLRQLGVHRPRLVRGHRGHWRDGGGATIPPPSGTVLAHSRPRYALAQINHYPLLSAEDFLLKTRRGRPNRAALPIGLEYWVTRNFNVVEDRRLARHAPALQAELAAMLADPQLARMQEAALIWRRERIAELLREPETFHLYTTLLTAGDTHPLPIEVQYDLLRQHMRLQRARHLAGSGSDLDQRARQGAESRQGGADGPV